MKLYSEMTYEEIGDISYNNIDDNITRNLAFHILEDRDDARSECISLDNALKNKDNAIDECIELVNQWKDFCKRNIIKNSYDTIQRQNNVHWKHCIENIDNLLEKLQKTKNN